MSTYVDRVSALSWASIWKPWGSLGLPGRLRRSEPAQGGNAAGKSSRVPIWKPWGSLGLPGRLRRSVPAQGGNAAGKSSRVLQ
uniref:Uncharacterized protein n=1 Tax=Ornithodoros erraticus TaxID=265619 RepID=A0A293ML97_ORNER